MTGRGRKLLIKIAESILSVSVFLQLTEGKLDGLHYVLNEEGALEAEDGLVCLLEKVVQRLLEAVGRDAVVRLQVALRGGKVRISA